MLSCFLGPRCVSADEYPKVAVLQCPFSQQGYISMCKNALSVTVCKHALHRVHSMESGCSGAQQPQRLCSLCLTSPSMSLLPHPPPACPSWLHPSVEGSHQSQHMLAPRLPGQRVHWSRIFRSTLNCVGTCHLKRSRSAFRVCVLGAACSVSTATFAERCQTLPCG